MENPILTTIDYPLLREQKLTVLCLRNKLAAEREGIEGEHLSGILHLLDALQDEAHRQGLPAFAE